MHLPEDSYGLGFRVYSAALEGSISNYDRKLSAVGSMLGTMRNWVTVKHHQQQGPDRD